MFAVRTLHLGFVVFVVVLLATIEIAWRRAEAPVAVTTAAASVTVVDVARGLDPAALATIVRLRADERVTAVDDRAVANDLAAGAAIAERPRGSGSFVDLTVTGAHGSRRVLVLLH